MSPTLDLLYEAAVTLAAPTIVGAGTSAGPHLRGRVLPSGGDWLLLGPDGIGRLDVRGAVETEDGACICLSYFGVLRLNKKVQHAIASGRTTEYGDTPVFIQPLRDW